MRTAQHSTAKDSTAQDRAHSAVRRVDTVIAWYIRSPTSESPLTFIADWMYALCTCGGRFVALGCRRASTTRTCTGWPLHDDRMSSPVGPSIQYPESPGVVDTSARGCAIRVSVMYLRISYSGTYD